MPSRDMAAKVGNDRNRAAKLTDSAVLLRATSGNREAFHQIMSVFLRIFPGMVLSLEQLFEDGDLPDLAHSAHLVRGCLALVGANVSAERIARIESAARNRTPQCHLAEFEKTMQELRSVIDEIESEFGPVPLLQQ
jgi:hypothetical protein